MKFAAILGAAAVLTAGAASAAEIGVRSTWGHTTRNIGHAEFINVGKSVTAGIEQSSGFAFGIDADGFEVKRTTRTEGGADGGFGADVDLNTTGELDGGKLFAGFGSLDQDVDLTTTGTVSGGFGFGFDSETVDRTEVDGSLTVAGSEYSRNGVYGGYSYSRESGSYSEHSTRGFSELSTFSR